MKRLANRQGSVYKLSGTRSKPWTARKTVGKNEKGQPKYKYIGYYRTKTEAMNALMEYNKSPYSLNGELLKDIYERFFESYKEKRAASTVDAMETKWRHLSPLHDAKLTDLTRKDLQEYFDHLDATEITKRKIKVTLKLIFDYAVRYDIIPPERTAILDYIDLSGKESERRPHNRITDEEIEELWEIDDEMSQFLLFLIYTGLRCGEYQSVTENGSIDADNIIHVTQSKTAAGVREVPMSDKALKLTRRAVFPSYDNMKYKYKLWRKEHGFEHKLHDTRHTCISLLTEAKVDERIIRAIVGHSGSSITEQVYTHISNEEKRDALNKM